MAKFYVDTGALIEHLKDCKAECLQFEKDCVNNRDYKNAMRYEHEENFYGNLIFQAGGSEVFQPETIENGGFFVRKLTKIREAVMNMPDEELAQVLYKTHTLKDGKLVARFNLDCVGKCPNFPEELNDGTDLIEHIMLQDA